MYVGGGSGIIAPVASSLVMMRTGLSLGSLCEEVDLPFSAAVSCPDLSVRVMFHLAMVQAGEGGDEGPAGVRG